MKAVCHKRFEFQSLFGKKVTGGFDGGKISSDGGGLLLRELDLRHDVTSHITRALHDKRSPYRVKHSLGTLLRQRMYGICLGYEDTNDHNLLRKDPVLKTACDMLPDSSGDLASQPTLSRLENQVSAKELVRLSRELFSLYLSAHSGKRDVIIIDIDSTDDPTHGGQQLSLFHGYYGQHMYHPLMIFDGLTGFPMAVVLRPGNSHASRGAIGILRRIIGRLQKEHPESTILVRADGGFAIPGLYELCEELEVHYLIGLITNSRLKEKSDSLLDQAIEQFEEEEKKQRLFTSFSYQADSWDKARRVIAKAECMVQGTNRRFVVTNLPGDPQLLYDDIYVHRGEMENRIKELKNQLKADRLSCHCFNANQFRLLLHTFAYCLLWFLREALQNSSLCCAQVDTIRVKILKVGVRVVETSRRVWLHLSSAYPLQELFASLLSKIQRTPV